MLALWLIAVFIGLPLVISAVSGLLYGLVVRQSTRTSIIAVSALGPSLLTALFGATISYLAVQADAGGEFFFGYVLIVFGLWAILPGMFAGRVVATHLRRHEETS